MKITVQNGTPFTLGPNDALRIKIEVDPAGETLPQTVIEAVGGQLDCYKSRLTQSGNIRLHLFGEGEGETLEEAARRGFKSP